MSFAAVAMGTLGLTKLLIGNRQKNKAKKEAVIAKGKMEADKQKYMNQPIVNPYAKMENTMEDLTVNTQAADFAAQKSAQSRANILDQMQGAAGGSGVAALAQTLANQAQVEAQTASQSIAAQEAENQKAERQEASSLQDLKTKGEASVQNLKRDRLATQLGMSQGELTAARSEEQAGMEMMASGVGDIAAGVGTLGKE